MSRARLLLVVAAALLLLLAALLRPAPEQTDASVEAAVGRSLGGLRVLLIDVMFLRAEALQTDGRLEESASLYRTILELDPANDSAAAYLVDIYVFGLLPLATTAEGRFAWWNEGWLLAHRALELAPGSPHLHMRVAQLLRNVPWHHPDLVERVDTLVPDREATAMVHLAEATRLTPNLPTLGYTHLMDLAAVAPQVAADAAMDGREDLCAQALATGRRLLDLRGTLMTGITYEVVEDGDATGTINYAQLLDAGLQTVEAMRAAEAAGDRAAMVAIGREYAGVCGQNVLLDRLAAWASR